MVRNYRLRDLLQPQRPAASFKQCLWFELLGLCFVADTDTGEAARGCQRGVITLNDSTTKLKAFYDCTLKAKLVFIVEYIILSL